MIFTACREEFCSALVADCVGRGLSFDYYYHNDLIEFSKEQKVSNISTSLVAYLIHVKLFIWCPLEDFAGFQLIFWSFHLVIFNSLLDQVKLCFMVIDASLLQGELCFFTYSHVQGGPMPPDSSSWYTPFGTAATNLQDLSVSPKVRQSKLKV